MFDGLLDDSARKEALSWVYVKALAAFAGYTTQRPDHDRDSVDLTVSGGGAMRPKLDLQLKATTVPEKLSNGQLSFRLTRKNYDDLRTRTQTPRLLVVLVLQEDERN